MSTKFDKSNFKFSPLSEKANYIHYHIYRCESWSYAIIGHPILSSICPKHKILCMKKLRLKQGRLNLKQGNKSFVQTKDADIAFIYLYLMWSNNKRMSCQVASSSKQTSSRLKVTQKKKHTLTHTHNATKQKFSYGCNWNKF